MNPRLGPRAGASHRHRGPGRARVRRPAQCSHLLPHDHACLLGDRRLFFGQVTSVSGFGGISGIPIRLLAAPHTPTASTSPPCWWRRLCTPGCARSSRTPFGLALQGIRDDRVRMRSLGYRVTLHRLLAFGLAGFVAAVGGILFVWWNAQIAPSTIDLTATIDVLLIAVIGGMFRLEGAWVEAARIRPDQQLRAGRRLRGRAVPHADRVDLPGHRARVPRRPGRPVGSGRSGGCGPSSPGETTGEGGSAAVPAGERGASTLTGS